MLAGCAALPPVDYGAAASLSARLASLPEDAWQKDLDLLQRTLDTRLPGAWHAVTRSAFAASLRAPAPPGATGAALARFRWSTVMKSLALLREGHTRLVTDGLGFARLPLGLEPIGPDLYVSSASGDALPLLGGRLVSVNGRGAAQAAAGLRPYLSAESDGWARVALAASLPAVDLLAAAGVARAGQPVVPVTASVNGTEVTAALAGSAADPAPRPTTTWEARGVTPADTIARRDSFYWYAFSWHASGTPGTTLVVQYNRCADSPVIPFEEFCRQLFDRVLAEKPRRLVLDLRYNTGGDSALFTRSFLPRVRASSVNRPGGIVVLIGPQVYSSGVFAVSDMKTGTSAVLLGEPTGEGWTHYGMTTRFMLPASGLMVQEATRLWRLPPGGGGDQVVPDIAVPVDPAEWLEGRDNQLEAAIALP